MMKLTIFSLLLFIGISSTAQIQNDKTKWLGPLTTYGVTYPRLGVTTVFQIPEYADTPVIQTANRAAWKNSVGRRISDNKVYIYDGAKWNSISSASVSSESDPIFTSSPAFSITSTNATNWNTAFGWGNHATAGYAQATHTHLLSNLLQSGATTGQVPQWNGTTWIPATVSSSGGTYVLPSASSSVLGGVKVGSGLSINGSSVLSATFNQAATDAIYATIGHTHIFSAITSKPTTLAGYGITDAALSSHVHAFSSLTSLPTTLSGYGITDAAALTHTHTFSSLTSRPTTISGYGITDALTQTQTDALYAAVSHTHAFASLTSKPTTLAGYGITDAASATHTHAFSSLTSKPTTLSGYGITDASLSTHTHTFSSLTSKPTTVFGYGITDALTANQTISFAPTGDVTGTTSGATSLTPVLSIGTAKVTNAMLAGGITKSKLDSTNLEVDSVSLKHFGDATGHTVTGTLAETTVYSRTVKANTLGPNGYMRLEYYIKLDSAAYINVYFGGDLLAHVAIGGTAGYQCVSRYSNSGSQSTGFSVYPDDNFQASGSLPRTKTYTVNTAADQNLVVTITNVATGKTTTLSDFQAFFYY